MCVQAVGLIQSAIEREGIATVSITLLSDVTETIRPPRALSVPFRFGYPLGRPHDAKIQHEIISEALTLLSENELPILRSFRNQTH